MDDEEEIRNWGGVQKNTVGNQCNSPPPHFSKNTIDKYKYGR